MLTQNPCLIRTQHWNPCLIRTQYWNPCLIRMHHSNPCLVWLEPLPIPHTPLEPLPGLVGTLAWSAPLEPLPNPHAPLDGFPDCFSPLPWFPVPSLAASTLSASTFAFCNVHPRQTEMGKLHWIVTFHGLTTCYKRLLYFKMQRAKVWD
jgi:hypothetical protein